MAYLNLQSLLSNAAADPSSPLATPDVRGLLGPLPQTVQSGLLGPDPQQTAQPAPQQPQPDAQQQQAPTPPQYGHRGFFGDLLDNVFLGGAIQQTRQAEYQRQLADFQARQMQQTMAGMSPEERAAFLANPAKFGEEKAKGLFAPTVLNSDQRLDVNGQTRDVAPGKFTVEPVSGRPINDMTGAVGPTLGGGMEAKDGLFLQPRTNSVLGTYGQFHDFPAANSTASFAPTIAMGPNGIPQITTPGQPAAVGAQPPAPGGNVPLPIRQNNPGALRALPNGQQWQGQTGIGPGGHVIFDTPQNGVRAALMNLGNKQAIHGLNTLQDIIAAPGVGWDPGNQSYVANVAKTTGFAPNQPIDLRDTNTLGKVADAIFRNESGPQWASYRPGVMGAQGASQSPSTAVAGAPPAGGLQVLSTGRKPATLSPEEAAAKGFAPGSVVEQDATGADTVKQPPPYTASNMLEQRKNFLDSKDYELHAKTVNAVNSLQDMMQKATGNNGFISMGALDNLVQAQTGLSARQGNVGLLLEHLGLPQEVEGKVSNMLGTGPITPQSLRQALSVLRSYGTTHQATVQTRLNGEQGVAKRYGYDLGIQLPQMNDEPAIPWLNGRKPGQAAPAPAPQDRKPGATYLTPKGNLVWTGTGWRHP